MVLYSREGPGVRAVHPGFLEPIIRLLKNVGNHYSGEGPGVRAVHPGCLEPIIRLLKNVGNHYSGEGPGATAGHAGSSSEFDFGQKSSHCFHSISGESVATGLPVGDWPKH